MKALTFKRYGKADQLAFKRDAIDKIPRDLEGRKRHRLARRTSKGRRVRPCPRR